MQDLILLVHTGLLFKDSKYSSEPVTIYLRAGNNLLPKYFNVLPLTDLSRSGILKSFTILYKIARLVYLHYATS